MKEPPDDREIGFRVQGGLAASQLIGRVWVQKKGLGFGFMEFRV